MRMTTKGLILFLILYSILNSISTQTSSNSSSNTTANSSKSNTTSNTTSNSSGTDSTNDTQTNNTSILDSFKGSVSDYEYYSCYYRNTPTLPSDCYNKTAIYWACCFMNLSVPYVGNTCVPMDISMQGMKFENFSTRINSNYTLPGSMYCGSILLEPWKVGMLIAIIVFMLL